jgi:hypothetical protein
MSFIPRASHLQRASAAVAVSCAAIFSVACSNTIGGEGPNGQPGVGGTGNTATGGGGATMNGGSGGTAAGGTGGSGTGGSSTGGSAGSGPLTTGGVTLRLLTRAEYLASLKSLFGNLTTPLDLPDDPSVGGYIALGASKVSVNPTGVDAYEAASRAVVAEVFATMARWQPLVGCQPQANLSDTCVETFVRTFGKRAFRRDLSDAESQQWVQVAREAAVLAGNNAVQGLSTLTSGLLQSPNFLYRVENTALDPSNDRLKYDGRSMADRLAFFLTGGPPSAELLAAGESGQLDTADGVRAAATSMLGDPSLVGRLTSFFNEYMQADLVMTAEKDPALFSNFNESMKTSMREGMRLFLERVVLAPGADVRTLFDSNQVFADATLAPIYGVTAPASGFAQFTAPPQQGRVGIMGQAGILAAHSKSDHSSPTKRGVFMLQAFLCTTPPPPLPGVNTMIMMDPTLTTRQRLERHRADDQCAGCHALFDPLGMALEHFDSIGQYRETENGLAIDPSGSLEDGTFINGSAELGTALRNNAAVTECLLRNFYRNVNGRDDDVHDQAQIDAMATSLSSRGYVFRDLIADFVVSDAFRSAPRVPITGGM